MIYLGNYNFALEEIAKVSNKNIEIVLVSKNISIDKIKIAVEEIPTAIFAEGKVQEIEDKVKEIKNFKFDFIGHIQTNKLKKLLKCNPRIIQSIDSLEHLIKLEEYLIELDIYQDCFLQINLNCEENKSGFNLNEIDKVLKQTLSLSRVKIKGLMAVCKKDLSYEEMKLSYTALNQVYNQMKSKYKDSIDLEYLSFGTSSNYINAIEYGGSNMIRLGHSIFGDRDYSLY